MSIFQVIGPPCTIDDGKYIKKQVWLKNVVEALYYAAIIVKWTLVLTGRIITLPLQSGVEIVLMDEDQEIPDFRMGTIKKYWAFKVSFKWGPPLICPLPKYTPEDNLIRYLQPIDTGIPGTENWLYETSEGSGVYDYGYNFEPERQYKVFANGIYDLEHLVFVYSIYRAIKDSGLKKLAAAFITWCLNNNRWRKVYAGIEDVNELCDKIYDKSKDTFDKVEEVIDSNETIISMLTGVQGDVTNVASQIEELSLKIGLRLSMR